MGKMLYKFNFRTKLKFVEDCNLLLSPAPVHTVLNEIEKGSDSRHSDLKSNRLVMNQTKAA